MYWKLRTPVGWSKTSNNPPWHCNCPHCPSYQFVVKNWCVHNNVLHSCKPWNTCWMGGARLVHGWNLWWEPPSGCCWATWEISPGKLAGFYPLPLYIVEPLLHYTWAECASTGEALVHMLPIPGPAWQGAWEPGKGPVRWSSFVLAYMAQGLVTWHTIHMPLNPCSWELGERPVCWSSFVVVHAREGICLLFKYAFDGGGGDDDYPIQAVHRIQDIGNWGV